ncbi:ankyrin-repeat domain containg transcription coregulator asaA-like [Strongylocentrotus purpuratus]|uniref:Uncharacterized protein n=1 Tax=Strongylocentrotus purpuratus TaxID=7668 RepID=A0A7M7P3Q6_STRPU|nr:ankyrin-repeat domain containg transcription coregulator asaA-like [Strongylocentrotus purpuratus]
MTTIVAGEDAPRIKVSSYFLLFNIAMIGADVKRRNAHGDTCLHLVVFATSGSRHPTKRLVEILLKSGADANGQNTKGDTPLHIAAMTNDPDMIQLLLLYGANPSISTFDGILPIHIAANAG